MLVCFLPLREGRVAFLSLGSSLLPCSQPAIFSCNAVMFEKQWITMVHSLLQPVCSAFSSVKPPLVQSHVRTNHVGSEPVTLLFGYYSSVNLQSLETCRMNPIWMNKWRHTCMCTHPPNTCRGALKNLGQGEPGGVCGELRIRRVWGLGLWDL